MIAPFNRQHQNGDLLRQRKNPGRAVYYTYISGLDFFASLHLTIFEQPADFEFFYNQLTKETSCSSNPAPDTGKGMHAKP